MLAQHYRKVKAIYNSRAARDSSKTFAVGSKTIQTRMPNCFVLSYFEPSGAKLTRENGFPSPHLEASEAVQLRAAAPLPILDPIDVFELEYSMCNSCRISGGQARDMTCPAEDQGVILMLPSGSSQFGA